VVADLHDDYPTMNACNKRTLSARLFNSIDKIDRVQGKVANLADSVIITSPRYKEIFPQRYGIPAGKISLVPNYQDLETLVEPEDVEPIDPRPDRFTLTFVGSTGSPGRGVQVAIQAMPRILEEEPDARLVIVGDGGYTPQLRELASRLELGDGVEFTGWVEFSLVPGYIASSDVCIITFMKEHVQYDLGNPHKLFQYMAAKKPVLVSDCYETSRHVKDSGAGLVFRSGDPDDFAARVMEMRASGSMEEMGARGYQAVRDRYNFESVYPELLSIYDSLAGEDGSTGNADRGGAGGLKLRSRLSRNRSLQAMLRLSMRLANDLVWMTFRRATRNDDIGRRFLDIFSASRASTLASGERELINAVESLRDEMLASDEVVTYTNFGAFAPEGTKSNEEREHGTEIAKTVRCICEGASQPRSQSVFLFRLIRGLRPARSIELGTCLGISAMYMGSALKLNGSGRMLTVEAGEALATIAARNLARMHLACVEVVTGRVEDKLACCLEDLGVVDFAFVDANHDMDATIRYFDEISRHIEAGSVVLFDDIRWSKGMLRAWKTIRNSPFATRTFDLGTKGIIAWFPDAPEKKHYRVAVRRGSPF